MRLFLVVLLLPFAVGCASRTPSASAPVAAAPLDTTLSVAWFAGGCFWCMEPPFDALPGVQATISGFTGGRELNPTYAQVSAGMTTHIEALAVYYDPAEVSYAELLRTFWINVDPFDGRGQFCDRGPHYRPALFPQTDEERALAAASLEEVQQRFTGQRIAVELLPADRFYPAEDYHQDFYQKNPDHYYRYREGCGRDRRLQAVWGNPPQY